MEIITTIRGIEIPETATCGYGIADVCDEKPVAKRQNGDVETYICNKHLATEELDRDRKVIRTFQLNSDGKFKS